MDLPIYLDHAATTPVAPEVLEAMLPYFSDDYGNPASIYTAGASARDAVDAARETIAQAIGADADEIFFTSGGTESDNWAIKGMAHARPDSKRHVLISAVEHHAVLDTAESLRSEGFDVEMLPVDSGGLVEPTEVASRIRRDTLVVSVMMANNEVGTIQPIDEIAAICREREVPFHTDAVQALGKLPISVREPAIALMSLSAHKLYGPKGSGALYVGPRAQQKVLAQIHGGGHEGGLRSGTLATHQIAAMGVAFALAAQLFDEEKATIARLRERLLEHLSGIPGVRLNGSATQRIPHTLSLTFSEGEFNSAALSASIAFSATSACNSASNAPSHVLLALGHDARSASRTIRLSLGRFTTEQDIDQAAQLIKAACASAPAFWQ